MIVVVDIVLFLWTRGIALNNKEYKTESEENFIKKQDLGQTKIRWHVV